MYGFEHVGSQLGRPDSTTAAWDRAITADRVQLPACIELPLREGEAFEFNNALPHAVRNEGPEGRVHLLIDVADHHVTAVTRLQPGQVCNYVKGEVDCSRASSSSSRALPRKPHFLFWRHEADQSAMYSR